MSKFQISRRVERRVKRLAAAARSLGGRRRANGQDERRSDQRVIKSNGGSNPALDPSDLLKSEWVD
jgi:hypothetical protein